jgi:hypothetical protein
MTDEAAVWVVEIGMPRAIAPKIAVVAPMFAATPVLALAGPDAEIHGAGEGTIRAQGSPSGRLSTAAALARR